MELASHLITASSPGPHLLITGGVHGDEFEPMAAIRRLMEAIPPVELRGRVTLVPVVNEPAFRLGRRTADDGLDLARTCPGRSDGLITERIAHALSILIRSADYYIDLHTGGTRLRVLPLVGYMLHRDTRVLAAQRQMARAFGLPIIWGTDSSLNGRSLSVARDANVPAIYAEYHGGGGCDPAGIDAYVRGCLGVLESLEMIAPIAVRPDVAAPSRDGATAAAITPILVEDDRPGSGHMQVNHPAPCEGFFEPAIKLGDHVKAGQTLGSVTDVLGHTSVPICAAHAGIVVVLHTFARVDHGAGLAVIIDHI